MHTHQNQVQKVLFITLGLNIFVAAIKLLYGAYTHSLSLEADGFHSLFDGASNIVGMVGMMLAAKPPDKSHPYGHRKIETFASIGIALLLFTTCFEIISNIIERLHHPIQPIINPTSFLIMIVTIAINAYVSVYEKNQGKILKSDFLMADAVHTTSDILVSASVIASFVAVLLNLPIIDMVIAGIIVLFIVYTGLKILYQNLNILMDAQTIDPELIKKEVLMIEGIKLCHKIRSRGTNNGIFIDLHIHVEPLMTVETAHLLTHKVIKKLKEKHPEILDVLIHTEPAYSTKPYSV